jgi:hypothetical protein
VDVALDYSLLPNLTTGGRVRSGFAEKVSRKDVKSFFSLGTRDGYDSQPPAQRATRNDNGVGTSLGRTFRR